MRNTTSRKAAPAKRAQGRANGAGTKSESADAGSPRSHEVASDAASADMMPIVGGNLRNLRKERALSLEALAKSSGVSRAMLGQIELGQSVPTINVLWKISRALGVTFSALITTQSTSTTTVLP